MSQHPRAGQPALAVRPRGRARAPARLRRDPPGPVRSRPARRLRHLGPPRLRVPGAPSTRPTSWPPPRRSAATGRRRATPGPLFIGRDTHALSEPAWRTALEVLVGERRGRARGRRGRLHADAGASRTRSSWRTAGRRRPAASRTASSSRRRTTRPTTAASSTTRPTAARPTPTSPVDPGRGEPDPGGAGVRRARRHPPRARSSGRARRPSATTSAAPTSRTSSNVVDMAAIAASGLRLGVDPLGGAAVAYWGADRRAVRPGPHGHQRARWTRSSGS